MQIEYSFYYLKGRLYLLKSLYILLISFLKVRLKEKIIKSLTLVIYIIEIIKIKVKEISIIKISIIKISIIKIDIIRILIGLVYSLILVK